ncbi:ABC transporter substrate-binding protein [Microlunatus soli]|uniref:Multiple sugar transport system substrate-binding protein n=1 Tax=Microlunatus soli TaxID=630515 RepID=A0A1H1YCE8_9ACTN|nr:sugar ABC transporter substrate-binding protein [Microlunatus soli]SDT19123.1 multiple sugar transport system substrate-binding protein [Microlunatus soli]
MTVPRRLLRRATRLVTVLVAATILAVLPGCSSDSGSDDGPVTLEFAQWWAAELPDGALAKLVTEFESQNPGIKIKLLTAPFASTKQQLISGAASRTLPDVMGLDGSWVNDFTRQHAIADLSELMTQAKYDPSQLASQVKVDGKTTMIPVVNFVYPMFVNKDLLKKAGVSKVPSTRSEFKRAAIKISKLGGNVKGWALPLDSSVPVGVGNDVMSWAWASGGSMLTPDGKPDLTGPQVTSVVQYLNELNAAGVISPGYLTMKEQDKVEKFTTGQVGMAIDTLAHINLIRKNNPELNFTVAPIPAVDGYTGKRGLPYASWGIGIAESSEHKEEAFKFVQFLLSKKANGELSTLANGFPGNKTAKPDLSESDPLFRTAYGIYRKSKITNEFVGMPKSEDLMRSFDEQLQQTMTGKKKPDAALATAQQSWTTAISGS